jgi:hypothetical protein
MQGKIGWGEVVDSAAPRTHRARVNSVRGRNVTGNGIRRGLGGDQTLLGQDIVNGQGRILSTFF